METEIWKDIPGYEGYYQISNLGNVKGLERCYVVKCGRRICLKEKILKKCEDGQGYLHVGLHKDGNEKTLKVAKLVLIAFNGMPKENEQVRHFPDRNKSNNRLDNLSWGTQSENEQDKFIQGGHTRGELQGSHKLNREDVLEIRRLLGEGEISQSDLARLYDVSSTLIRRIQFGKKWGWFKP